MTTQDLKENDMHSTHDIQCHSDICTGNFFETIRKALFLIYTLRSTSQ